VEAHAERDAIGACPFRLTHPGLRRTDCGRSSGAPSLAPKGHPASTQVFRVMFQPPGGRRPSRTADRPTGAFRVAGTPRRPDSLTPPGCVAMMEPADNGRLDDPALVEVLHESRLRSVLVEGEVRSGTVVVDEVVAQQATQMGFVQHHRVVEALAAESADETFDVRILLRRPSRRLAFVDTWTVRASRTRPRTPHRDCAEGSAGPSLRGTPRRVAGPSSEPWGRR
jgi:hypothetical protein